MKIHFLGTAASEGIPNPFAVVSTASKPAFVKAKTYAHTLQRLSTMNCSLMSRLNSASNCCEMASTQQRSDRYCSHILTPIISTSAIFLAGWKGTDLRLLIRCTFLVMTVQLTVPPKCYRATALKDLLFIVWFPS